MKSWNGVMLLGYIIAGRGKDMRQEVGSCGSEALSQAVWEPLRSHDRRHSKHSNHHHMVMVDGMPCPVYISMADAKARQDRWHGGCGIMLVVGVSAMISVLCTPAFVQNGSAVYFE